jgi:hypothetical protein
MHDRHDPQIDTSYRCLQCGNLLFSKNIVGGVWSDTTGVRRCSYLLVGSAWNKRYGGITDLRGIWDARLLPHRGFWIHLHGLVLDGVAFSRARLRGGGGGGGGSGGVRERMVGSGGGGSSGRSRGSVAGSEGSTKSGRSAQSTKSSKSKKKSGGKSNRGKDRGVAGSSRGDTEEAAAAAAAAGAGRVAAAARHHPPRHHQLLVVAVPKSSRAPMRATTTPATRRSRRFWPRVGSTDDRPRRVLVFGLCWMC